MKFKKNQDYWANVFLTNEFLLIETQSGLGMVATDPLFPPHLLQPDSDNQSVGLTILQALSDSRTLTDLADRVALFDLEKGKEQYVAWIANLMNKYGYKTKRALFKNMKNCGVHCVNEIITISPTKHETLEAWGREKDDGIEVVILSADSSPEAIGAGLRLALSRCK